MLSKNANNTPASTSFIKGFDGAGSPEFPQGWTKAVNRSRDKIDAQISQAGTFGGKTVVTVTNTLTNYLGMIYLEFTMSNGVYEITTMGPCAADYLGYAVIDKIRVRYGQNNVYEVTGQQMKDFFHEERSWNEYKELVKDDIKGPLTENARRALLKNPTTSFYVPLFVFWGNNSNQNLPQVLGSNIEIDIEWKPSSEWLLDTNAGPNVGFRVLTEPQIITQKVRMNATYVEPTEVAALVARAQSAGIFTLTKEFQTQVIPSPGNGLLVPGVNKITLDINKSINGGVVALYINLYRQQDYSVNFKKRSFNRRGGKYDKICEIKNFRLKSAGVEVRTPYTAIEMKHEMLSNRYNQGAVLSNQITVDFAKLVDQVSTNTGQIDFSALNNLQLEMDVVLNPGYDQFVPVWEIRALTSNIVKIQKGTMQKIFF